jgi:hypothetical protein
LAALDLFFLPAFTGTRTAANDSADPESSHQAPDPAQQPTGSPLISSQPDRTAWFGLGTTPAMASRCSRDCEGDGSNAVVACDLEQSAVLFATEPARDRGQGGRLLLCRQTGKKGTGRHGGDNERRARQSRIPFHSRSSCMRESTPRILLLVLHSSVCFHRPEQRPSPGPPSNHSNDNVTCFCLQA